MSAIDQFAAMVAPPAGYQPGVDPEHIYFAPLSLAAKQAVGGSGGDPASGGTPVSLPAERAIEKAFGGQGMADVTSTGVDPTAKGPQVVDTSGQFDATKGGVGGLAGMALPGGSATTAFGKMMQAIEGPYAVVGGYENARPGTRQWDANMAAQRQAHNQNQAHFARRDSGGAAAVVSSRSIDTGASRGRGGISDPSLGRTAAQRALTSGRAGGVGTPGVGGGFDGGANNNERVICTELYRQGRLSREDWKRDLAFTAKHLTRQHVDGYHWWACAVVKALRRGRWVGFWTFWAKHRANEIAYLMGDRPRGDWLGKAFRWTVEPACWVIGGFVGESDWRALYREERV